MTDYRLAQVADYICIIELAGQRYEIKDDGGNLQQVLWHTRLFQEELVQTGAKKTLSITTLVSPRTTTLRLLLENCVALVTQPLVRSFPYRVKLPIAGFADITGFAVFTGIVGFAGNC